MDTSRVPATLRERLGTEATAGLVDLFNDARAEWRVDVISAAADRYERRLLEETSKLRVEMVQGFASLRQQIAGCCTRQELREESAALRADIATVRGEVAVLRGEIGDVRREIADLRAQIGDVRGEISGLRQEIASGRFELLKWAFVFWVGQFIALAGLMAVVIQQLRSGG